MGGDLLQFQDKPAEANRIFVVEPDSCRIRLLHVTPRLPLTVMGNISVAPLLQKELGLSLLSTFTGSNGY